MYCNDCDVRKNIQTHTHNIIHIQKIIINLLGNVANFLYARKRRYQYKIQITPRVAFNIMLEYMWMNKI